MFRTEASATPASSAQVSLHKRHRVRGVENIDLCRYLGVEVDIYLHIYTATVCDITILIITTLHDKCIQTRCVIISIIEPDNGSFHVRVLQIYLII